METKRLFIALPIEIAVSKDIIKKLNTFDLPWEKLKVVRPEQIHLTLKFLGNFNIEKLPELLNALNNVNIDTDDMEINIDQTQIFNPQQPKVLALSIEKNDTLQKLYDQIEQVLFDNGIAHKEVRRFSAHLTLARIKKVAEFKEFEEFNNWKINKSFFVPYFELLESELGKTGPEYTVLQTFDL